MNMPVAALFLGGCFFVLAVFLFLFSLPPHTVAAQGTAVLMSAVATTDNLVPPAEVHIASNGLVLLRNAWVVAVNGTIVTLSTKLGSSDFTWVVNTNASSYETHNFGTRFLNRDGTKSSLQRVSVGGLITVTGMLKDVTQEPVIDADSVRILN